MNNDDMIQAKTQEIVKFTLLYSEVIYQGQSHVPRVNLDRLQAFRFTLNALKSEPMLKPIATMKLAILSEIERYAKALHNGQPKRARAHFEKSIELHDQCDRLMHTLVDAWEGVR